MVAAPAFIAALPLTSTASAARCCSSTSSSRPRMTGVVPRETNGATAPSVVPNQAPALTDPHPAFGRIITAMVTPFKRNNTEVDYSTAERLAAHLVANGSDALVVAGTTGESPTLSWSETYELFTVIRNAVGHRTKLIAGAGSNSTAEAIDATRRAARLGFDATLQVAPYYNKPPQEGLYQHFRAVADSQPDLPVILYNVPGRTGINIAPETTERLAQIPNIVGLKQATDDLDALMQIRKNTPSDFHIYAGDDSLTLPFLSLGATGVISVASHVIGNEMQQMVQSFINGDVETATSIHMRYSQVFADLFCMTNPIPTKTALRLLGWPVGGCRLPLIDATPEVEQRLTNLLTSIQLL